MLHTSEKDNFNAVMEFEYKYIYVLCIFGSDFPCRNTLLAIWYYEINLKKQKLLKTNRFLKCINVIRY